LNASEIIRLFNEWSKDKSERFTDNDIEEALEILINKRIIEKNLIGYTISKKH